MLRKLLDSVDDYRTSFLTLFCNTGKERDETLDFVHEMETRWNVPIVWLEYVRCPAIEVDPSVFPTKRRQLNHQKLIDAGENCHWFKLVNYETAHRNGKPNGPFDRLLQWAATLPNVSSRMCSVQMKVRTMERYLFSCGVYEWSDHIGIRADEKHRTIEILANAPSYTSPRFPLVEAGVTESDVYRFWSRNEFDLRLRSDEGNCDLCFLKRKQKLVKLVRDRPESVKWWKEQERIFASKASADGRYFRLNQPYDLIEHLAINPHPELFPTDDTENDIPCSCAERAYSTETED